MTMPLPAAGGGTALYTPQILALAVELADFPLGDDLTRRGEAVSRVCGSRVAIGLTTATDGAIERIGARVTACAIGQAAAALFARAASGASAGELANALAAIDAWLAGDEPAPRWPELMLLEPARAYPARHPAILLPWRAALAALSNPVRAD